jgi:hypothetical protein
MATLSYKFTNDKGSYFTATITYTTSETNEGYTVSVNKVKYSNVVQSSTDNVAGVVALSMVAISGQLLTFNGQTIVEFSGSVGTEKTLSGSKTIEKTHSKQTVLLAYKMSNSSSNLKSINITINAKPSYVITYNANGGLDAPASQIKWYGETLTLQSGKPTRKLYVFKCWNTAIDGSGVNYKQSDSYTANSAAILYAQWERRNRVKIYDDNGNVRVGKVTVYDDNGNSKDCIISVYDSDGNKRYTQ